MIETDDSVDKLGYKVESSEASLRTFRTSDDHSHQLVRTNIQICQECHRFFVITYEKNEKGEAVETAYELDAHAKQIGPVKPDIDSTEIIRVAERRPRRNAGNSRDETCW